MDTGLPDLPVWLHLEDYIRAFIAINPMISYILFTAFGAIVAYFVWRSKNTFDDAAYEKLRKKFPWMPELPPPPSDDGFARIGQMVMILVMAVMLTACTYGNQQILETRTMQQDDGSQVVRTVNLTQKFFRIQWGEATQTIAEIILRALGGNVPVTGVIDDKPVEPRKEGESIEEWRKRTGRD
jgi:cell division protein FtsL